MPDDARFIAPDQVEEPPQPPRLEGAPRLYRFQWIGVPLLVLVVLLAMLDVFGETTRSASAAGGVLAVEVDYPGRFRYKQLERLWIRVENRSARTLDTVRVALDPGYLGAFSTVNAIPAFEDLYTVPLVGVRPGEARRVEVEVQAEEYGMHRGRLTASSGADSVRLELGTFVFP